MIKKEKKITHHEKVICDYCHEEVKREDIVAILNGDFHHACLAKKLEEDRAKENEKQ